MLTQDQLLQKGRYRIINQLGPNGLGLSYEALDLSLDTTVLLKEIPDNLNKVTTPAQIELRKLAFASEAKILTELKHGSLLLVNHYFSEIDRHYLVAENVEGYHLGELMEKNKTPIALSNVALWADQLLDAVNYLHQQTPPLYHRDIKPQNIKLTANGKIKLLTFPLALEAEAKASTTFSGPSFDPSALPYSPLEQIWEGLDTASKKVILNSYDEESEKILELPADARSDIYSIGATLYHLLTARLPIDALTRSIDILEGKIDPLPTPFELNSSIPSEVSDVIMTALEIRREHRFSAASIMRQVMRTAFVRVKEREEQVLREDVAAQAPAAVPQQPVKQPVKPENVNIEDEQKKQLELIKQQLREAEAKRLEAERRAAEAEKRLLEKEAKMLKVKDMVILQPKDTPAPKVQVVPPDADVQNIPAPQIQTEVPEPVAERKESLPVERQDTIEPVREQAAPPVADEFDNLFAQPAKESGMFKKLSVAAGLLIVLGGAAWAVWTFALVKPATPGAEPTAEISTPAPVEETTPPVPTIETANAPQPETTTPTAPETTADQNTETEESPETPSVTAAAKTRAVAAQTAATPVKKQNVAATKPPANEKKSVTLDDLLKDN